MKYVKGSNYVLSIAFFFMISTSLYGETVAQMMGQSGVNNTQKGPFGALGRVGKNSMQALDLFGTASNKDMVAMIHRYAPYADIQEAERKMFVKGLSKGTFDNVLQDHALLMEGFFAQLALMMDSTVAPKVDLTRSQIVNTNLVLQSGLKPTDATSTQLSKTLNLPKFCGNLFNMSRYIRGLGSSVSGLKSIPTRPIDSFYGVVVANFGWLGSPTGTTGVWASNPKMIKKGGIYWIPSGITATSFGKNKMFIVSQESGVARVEGGPDKWGASDNSRFLSFIITDESGGQAFSSEKNPFQLTISDGSTPDAPIIKMIDTHGGIKTLPITADIKSFLNKTASLPWAVLVEVTNGITNGKPDLRPTIEMKGLIRLNPAEFPFHYEPPASTFVDQPFTSNVLTEGVRALQQEIYTLPSYNGSTVEQNIAVASCKDASLQLKLSTGNPSGLYIQSINFALAKYYGALSYNWGSKFKFEEALKGSLNILEALFVKNSDLFAANLHAQITGSLNNKKIKRDPSFLIF